MIPPDEVDRLWKNDSHDRQSVGAGPRAHFARSGYGAAIAHRFQLPGRLTCVGMCVGDAGGSVHAFGTKLFYFGAELQRKRSLQVSGFKRSKCRATDIFLIIPGIHVTMPQRALVSLKP